MSRHAAGPANDIMPVTPGNNFLLPRGAEGDSGVGLYVETGGTLHVLTADDEDRTFTVADFSHHPVAVKKVYADSTATGIHMYLG